ncbi:MAG: flagellar export protein FliJ [Desulfobacteraceae bacterium]|nr:flagellar export protein FliJ [Desulfobacteraceae bacterium]
MAFQFKLEAVRRYRQFEEDRCQREFADAQRQVEQAKAILAAMIARRTQTEEDFRQGQADGESAAQAAMYRGFLERLGDEIETQQNHLASAEKACEEKRQALLEAMKKRKTIDRLKEKGEQAFMAELNSEEQKFINEIAINRHILKNR